MPQIERFFNSINKTKTCWLWKGAPNTFGYGQIANDRGIYTTAHRYSWTIHYGKVKNGLLVLHKCDVRLCVNPHHLWLGTQADNIHDAMKKNRRAIGEKHGMAVISEKQVREIRRKHIPYKVTRKILSKEFNISESNVKNIICRNIWKHVK